MGSEMCIRDSSGASAWCVVANINATTHQALAPEYARAAGRLIILSGFPERHEAGVIEALDRARWGVCDRLTDHEWVCLVFEPRQTNAV